MTYRFSVYAYRIGEISENIFLILMWIIIYHNGAQVIKGFTLNEMVSYLLIGNFIDVIVRNWLSPVVAGDIKDGRLSMFLVKPMKYLHYIIAREIGRISFALIMSVLSNLIIVLLFKKYLALSFDWILFIIVVLMVVLAFVVELLISYLVGLIAFWILEVESVFYTVERVKKFFSGAYFPISLLPKQFLAVSFFLPFAYSYFVPAQLFLGKLDIYIGLRGLAVQVIWIVLLLAVIKIVWLKGIRQFEGAGI